MAIVTNRQETTNQPSNNTNNGRLTNSTQQEPIMGYLNIRIKDSQGEYHNIRSNIPLFESNRIHKGILNKANKDPEGVMELIATVNLLSDAVPEF